MRNMRVFLRKREGVRGAEHDSIPSFCAEVAQQNI